MGSLSDRVDDAATTLVCAPSTGSENRCPGFMSAATGHTMWVTYSRSPSACIEEYRATATAESESLSVIAVGDMATVESPPDDVTVESVSAPEDLTGLGITLSQLLSDHEQATVCFDSLTVLLQYVDHETAYEFLNAVTGHLYAADASAHFHLDPTAHERREIDALASLFDAIAEWDDGEWSVRKRKLLQ